MFGISRNDLEPMTRSAADMATDPLAGVDRAARSHI